MPHLYIKDFGDAIVNYIKDNVASLEIDGIESADVGWARALNNEPVYVVNPITELPKIKVRFMELSTAIGPSQRLECMYEYSIFLFLKQNRGEEHQQVLVEGIESIAELFSTNNNLWRINEFADVGSGAQQLNFIYPSSINLFSEMKHSIDSPDIRISSAEVRLTISSWSFNV